MRSMERTQLLLSRLPRMIFNNVKNRNKKSKNYFSENQHESLSLLKSDRRTLRTEKNTDFKQQQH